MFAHDMSITVKKKSICAWKPTCPADPTVRGCLYTQSMYDQAVASDDFMEYRDDYRWRPDCTPDGDYSEKQCKGPVGEKRWVKLWGSSGG